jgi:glutamyl-tRNA reductase
LERGVIVLGAGEAAEGVLRALHQQGVAPVTLLNRHPEKARVLASAWQADVGALEEVDQHLERADLLIVATASPRPVVTVAQLSRAMTSRGRRKLVVMDLAVPRNVQPAARSLDCIHLCDLDDLQRLCCPATGTISAELADAERVVEEEVARAGSNLRRRAVAPKLAELHRLGSEMAEQEATWALAQLGTLSDTQRDVVRQMADRLVRRVLYPVSRNIHDE